MTRYILKRIVMMLPVLIGITFLVFMLMSFAPGDPAKIILGTEATDEAIAALRKDMGLDDPRLVRYARYMWNLVRGDMGMSYRNNISVASQIGAKLPNTILLASASMIFSIAVGLPVGILSARRQYSIFDNVAMVSALVTASAPAFWLGLVFVIVFSLTLKWFPSSGMGNGLWECMKSLVLPAVTIGAGAGATIARMTRSSMLEVIREDYISTARMKGINEFKVMRDHMLRNALIPIVTVIGVNFGALLGGSVMTETVFSWPGLGKHVVDAVKSRDMPTVLGCVIVLSLMFSIVNLIIDIAYAFIDPRIKSQYEKGGRKR